jgi:acetyltransferase-like isoleucine patch superfamily enzyme
MNVIWMVAFCLLVVLFVPLPCAYCSLQKRRRATHDYPSDTNAGSGNSRRVWGGIGPYLVGYTRLLCLLYGRIPSFRLRRFCYRHIFRMTISKKAIIYGGCEFRDPWNISIGDSVIGPNCILDGRRGLFIGDHVCFGSQIAVWTLQHSYQDPDFGTNGGAVYIEDYCWITFRTTVLPGRRIGFGCVTAANSVVSQDLEAHGVYAGVPCRRVAERNRDLHYRLTSHWHFY